MVDCVPEDLGNTVDTFADSSCQSSQSPPSVGSVQIRNGTACYDGLQTGSEAVYSCMRLWVWATRERDEKMSAEWSLEWNNTNVSN